MNIPLKPNLIGVLEIVIYLLSELAVLSSAQLVYFDNYDDCSAINPLLVEDEEYTVFAKTRAKYVDYMFSTLKCSLRFKSDAEDPLCLDFTTLSIEDCGVYLHIYDSSANHGSTIKSFTCGDTADTICGTGRYLTLELEKKKMDKKGYDFQITVRKKTQADRFRDGVSAFAMSLGAVIVVIVVVVAVIIICAILIVCCCCRKKKTSKGHTYQSPPAQGTRIPVQPSAPPLPQGYDYSHTDQSHQIHMYHQGAPPPYSP